MVGLFEELDYVPTRMGALTLRRRRGFSRDSYIYEIKLGEEFLMSSVCTASEIALADLAMAELHGGELDIVVGGLGLGYTADGVLQDDRVKSLLVVEAMPEVIEWHENGLLPLGPRLVSDPRCRFVQGDFFAMATSSPGSLDLQSPDRRFDAIIVDIDHSPRQLLHHDHGALYGHDGLNRVAYQLKSEGVFALWSNDPPDPVFSATLDTAFTHCRAEIVRFRNPLNDREEACTVYVAKKEEPSS